MPDISADDIQKMRALSAKSVNDASPSRTVGQESVSRAELNMPRINIERAAPIDIEAISKRYDVSMKKAIAESNPSDFIIFVSLSMPRETLQALSEQASMYGAVLVLRGLKNNSLKATVAEIKSIIGDVKVGWQINPVAFTRFNVQAVPAFVITKGNEVSHQDTKGCAPPASYLSVSGDVSAEYALEKLAGSATPDFSPLIDSYVQKGKHKW